MPTLASFVRFRLFFDAGSDPAHASTTGLFTDDVNQTDTPAWGRYLQVVFEIRDASGAWGGREKGMFGVHYVNVTGGAVDTSWVTADFTAVESAWSTFWSAIGSKIPNDFRLSEFRWYPFGPGVIPPNYPVRVQATGPTAGTYSTTSPAHQVASTVTFRTPLRRHWGRIYVPMSGSSGATGGVITSTDVDTLATAARTALTGPFTSQGILPVVWDRNRHRAYGITEIEVDNVPDIIRRRRLRSATYRKIFTS